MPTFNKQPIKISYSAILLTSNGSILTGQHFLNVYISPQFSEGQSHLRRGCNFTEYSIIKKMHTKRTVTLMTVPVPFLWVEEAAALSSMGPQHQKQRQGKS